MAKDGYIKDYRKELESDIWLMPPMYHRVWQWIKYSVNHAENKIPNRDGSHTELRPGQHATSYRLIAQGVGYFERGRWREPNVKTIKSILDWLSKQQMICVDGNSNGTILTVENWCLYQSENLDGNSKRISKSTLGKHSLDTNKNEKNDKNEKKDIYSDLPAELHQPLKDFIEMRKTIKKPLTDRAAQMVLDKLQELSNGDITTKVKILQQSTMNCWQGIFPLRDQVSSNPFKDKLKGMIEDERNGSNSNHVSYKGGLSKLLQEPDRD